MLDPGFIQTGPTEDDGVYAHDMRFDRGWVHYESSPGWWQSIPSDRVVAVRHSFATGPAVGDPSRT